MREEVSTITGVTDLGIDLACGELTVSSERPIEREAVAAAVEEAGYAV